EKLGPKLNYWLDPASRVTPSTSRQIAALDAAAQQDLLDIAEPKGPLETLNASTLHNLQLQIGAAFERSIEAYLKDTYQYIQDLGDAIVDGDAERIRHFAHVIKGSSANLGANRLAALGADLEAQCAGPGGGSLLKSLREEYERVRRLLVRHLEAQPSQSRDSRRPSFQAHVLIVDDDKSSRIVMQGVLEKDGYAISQARNGMEALRLCEESMPDLILMDALVPVMDGFTACKRILALGSQSCPTILMITALQDEGTLERAFAAGATDFVVKPINMTVLR